MKSSHLPILLTFSALFLNFIPIRAAELTSEDKQFLTGYEKVRSALAADDLNSAKMGSSELGEAGATLAKSEKIEAARAEFTKLSERAIQLGRGQSGYYVVNCPMLKKDWLQISTKISNPYAGKSMPDCGVIKK